MGNWKSAFLASPGPSSWKDAGILYLKGLCMGAADIVPGVSGGTIALITGIYSDLLTAIQSIDLTLLRRIFTGNFSGALEKLHLRFLLSLLAGIATGIMGLSRLMNYLLAEQPVHTWSLFFGLILASVLIVAKRTGRWDVAATTAFFCGFFIAWIIVSLIPVSTPDALWFVFISGFIAICAMILPGISGAFILLLLGKYAYVTGCLRNPFLPENLLIIAVFCIGCLSGLLLFSRVLNYFLKRYPGLCLALLTGFMAGSMKKIWPWKIVVETRQIGDRWVVIRESNIWPQSFNGDVAAAILVAVVGFAAVLALEKISEDKQGRSAP